MYNVDKQNEWHYVRSDFKVATKQFEEQKLSAPPTATAATTLLNVEPPLGDIVDQILTLRSETSLIQSDHTLNDLIAERNALVGESAKLKQRLCNIDARRSDAVFQEDPRYLTSGMTEDMTEEDERKKLTKRTNDFIDEENNEIELLKKQLEEQREKLTPSQLKMYDDLKTSCEKKEANEEGKDEAKEETKEEAKEEAKEETKKKSNLFPKKLSLAQMVLAAAPDHVVAAAAKDEGKNTRLKSIIQVKILNPRSMLRVAKEMNLSVHVITDTMKHIVKEEEVVHKMEKDIIKNDKQILIKNNKKKECQKQKEVRDKLNTEIEKLTDIKKERENRSKMYHGQIEELHVAIEEDMKMKQLSKLNPVSMLDFYKNRVLGQEESAIGIVTKIKILDEKEINELLKKEAAEKVIIEEREKQMRKSISLKLSGLILCPVRINLLS